MLSNFYKISLPLIRQRVPKSYDLQKLFCSAVKAHDNIVSLSRTRFIISPHENLASFTNTEILTRHRIKLGSRKTFIVFV